MACSNLNVYMFCYLFNSGVNADHFSNFKLSWSDLMQ